MGWLCRRPAVALVAAALAAALVSCSSGDGAPTPSPSAKDAVVVASFNFPESVLLAEIYAGALERAGVPVRRELDLGPRELVQPALQQGKVDVVPEYLGTALASIAPDAAVDRADTAAVHAALTTALAPSELRVLEPAAAVNQNAFAVTAATAERLRLRTVSDLAGAARALSLGGPAECPTRPYCLRGLETVYGARFRSFVPIDDDANRVTALADGVIDVAVVFTTDAYLANRGLVLLADDRHLQPVENVVPVVSDRVAARYGTALVDALNRTSRRITTSGLAFLNWRVAVAGKRPADEARGWLARHGA